MIPNTLKKLVPAKHRLVFWLWAGLAYGLAVIVLLLIIKLLLSGKELTEQAIQFGQRATVYVESNVVEGNVRKNSVSKIIDAKPTVGMNDSVIPSPLANANASVESSDSSLVEKSDKGMLPIISANGVQPWKYYARAYNPTNPNAKRPMVAIIFTNLGLSRPLTTEVLKLPRDFTLSFSPYASDITRWATRAHEIGFESFIDLPMQDSAYPVSDPGPFGLLENLNPNENGIRLHQVLGQFTGYVGTLAPVDEKLTADLDVLRPELTELASRGVLFLYVKTPQNAALADFAKSHSLYVLGIDKVIDAEITRGAIDTQLQSLVDLAKTQGYAIGVAHSYPPTLEALAAWDETLNAQGVDLVPVSAIGKRVFP